MPETLTLTTPDDARLGAATFAAPHPTDRWVIIAGGTGIPQTYYHALAEWLTAHAGVNVLTFDYRGVGASRPERLRGYRADYLDWVADLDAVIAHTAARGPTAVVGHSYGGQAFGLGQGHRQTRGLYVFGLGAGWHGYMPRGEGIKARLFWHVISPPAVRLCGYLPGRRLRFGEDLPLGVYRDWKRWCALPDHFFGDGTLDAAARFARVEVPVMGVNSVDDPWSGTESGAVLLSRYKHGTQRMIEPSHYGLHAIGHMSYVRPSSAALWPDLADWLSARLA